MSEFLWKPRAFGAVLMVLVAIGTLACDRPKLADDPGGLVKAEVSAQALQNVRIFFAHQSVGQNLVDGVRSLAGDAGEKFPLSVADLGSEGSRTGVLIHAKLGQNGDPAGKTTAFVQTLSSGLGDTVDIAMQKYCFADISSSTDPVALFNQYRDALSKLEAQYPKVSFVHITAPLTVLQSGPKATVKKLIGRAPDQYADNIVRERFNELMRHEYSGKEPLFDLAALESTPIGGQRTGTDFDHHPVFGLLPEFSIEDGAHLNGGMQRRAAVALLEFLAHVAASPHASAARP